MTEHPLYLPRADLWTRCVAAVAGSAAAAAVVVLEDARLSLEAFYFGLFMGIVFGAITYFTEVAELVPDAPELPPAPEDEPVRREGRLRLLLMLPLGAGLAWLALRWDAAGAAIPAALLAPGVAALVGAQLVRRWEREHGARVLARRGDGEPSLYAGAPP
jgi:hypothetical protein